MLIDSTLAFGLETALNTGGAGTYNFGSAIDLKTANINQGVTNIPLYLYANVQTAIAAGGGGTVQFQFVTADDAALTSNVVVLLQTLALDAASGIAQGEEIFNISLPKAIYQRYVGFRQVTAVAAVSAGALNAMILREPGDWTTYPINTLGLPGS